MNSCTSAPADGSTPLRGSPNSSPVPGVRLDSERPSACRSGFTKDLINKRRLRPHLGRHTLLVAAFAVGVCYLIDASNASAAETAASQMQMKSFPMAQVFTLLFLMLGPFKIIGPFSKITKGADDRLIREIALRSTLFSSLALLFAALLGETILLKYGVPAPVLALSAGIILFLVALQNILQQFAPPMSQHEGLETPTSTMSMALTPLAFPTIVTPYSIAALIVFLAFSPDLQSRLVINAIVVAIMLLNLVAMISTRHIPRLLGVLLAILGAVSASSKSRWDYRSSTTR
jgi:multiple antibiotic resistance protein